MHGWIAHIDNEPVGHIHMLLESNKLAPQPLQR